MKKPKTRNARSQIKFDLIPYSFRLACPYCQRNLDRYGYCLCGEGTNGSNVSVATTSKVPRLDHSTEQGFLFLDRLKLVQNAFLASLSGSLVAALICITAFFLVGCASVPELTVDEKDGSLCVCVEGQCYKAAVDLTRPKACLLK